MLLLSNGILAIWASGFSCESSLSTVFHWFTDMAYQSDLKHKYWYMNIPEYGIMATPIVLYTPRDLALARALNGFVTGKVPLTPSSMPITVWYQTTDTHSRALASSSS